MKLVSEERKKTAEAVAQAVAAWAKAPVHVKAMAGAFVGPLLAVLVAVNEELQEIDDGNS